MTIVWTDDDKRFLKALRIDPGPAPFKRGERFTGEVRIDAESSPEDVERALEPAYVRAMLDPSSERNGGGHPRVCIAFYHIRPVAARSAAVWLARDAHARGEHCKCGALIPHFACYV